MITRVHFQAPLGTAGLPAARGRRTLIRRLPATALAAALATFAAACTTSAPSSSPSAAGASPADQAFPVNVTAANGSVHISKRPASIISLAPSATELLYAIGAGSQVTAVDQDSNFPAGTPRTALSGLTPNIEAIVGRKPDLVVVSYDATTLTKRLSAFGIPVLDLPAPADLSGVYTELDELGQATGHAQQAAAEVSTLRSQVSAIVARIAHHAKPLTYYYELDQTYYSVTSSTFIGRLLGLLGMKSIADSAKGAAAAGGYPQLSAEYILKANPDYVILADTICCHQSASTVQSRPGWGGLAAVKAKHIILLNDDIASRWGPRIVTLLDAVLAGVQGHQ